MRLRYKLVLAFTLVTALPLLVALPLALRDVQEAFDKELDNRLDGAARSAKAALADAEREVERAVRDLSSDPAVEEVARSLHGGGIDRAEVAAMGERLMALAGVDALELLDGEGRILTSGHLPARAGDPDLEALELAGKRKGRAVVKRIEVRTATGIAPALALVAAHPVDYGTSRIYLVVGRILGQSWVTRISELTGAVVTVSDLDHELARSAKLLLPRTRSLPIADGTSSLGAVQVEVSDEALREAKARVVRGAAVLWLLLLISAGLLGSVIAARITRPVDALSRGARAIARGELGHEVKARATAELGELVSAFNAMSMDLKTATERASVAERVAAWQEVARRLAHEIKNPLTPIKMSVETLLAAHRTRRADFDEIFNESAVAVLEEVERLRKIVDEFSRFARLPKPEMALLDLSDLAAMVLTLYASTPEGIEIDRALGEGLQVKADRDQLTQVLVNLLTNAEQAMTRGGKVTLRTLAAGPGEVAVEVEDEGPGVRPEDRQRLFEPYFTTKESGTGLGLAIAQRIAQEHGGRIEELGELGKGARFRLTLPRAS